MTENSGKIARITSAYYAALAKAAMPDAEEAKIREQIEKLSLQSKQLELESDQLKLESKQLKAKAKSLQLKISATKQSPEMDELRNLLSTSGFALASMRHFSTQGDVARSAGIHQPTVSQIENNQPVSVSNNKLFNIVSVYVDLHAKQIALLERTKKPTKPTELKPVPKQILQPDEDRTGIESFRLDYYPDSSIGRAPQGGVYTSPHTGEEEAACPSCGIMNPLSESYLCRVCMCRYTYDGKTFTK